jgi:hypothetical protein
MIRASGPEVKQHHQLAAIGVWLTMMRVGGYLKTTGSESMVAIMMTSAISSMSEGAAGPDHHPPIVVLQRESLHHPGGAFFMLWHRGSSRLPGLTSSSLGRLTNMTAPVIKKNSSRSTTQSLRPLEVMIR